MDKQRVSFTLGSHLEELRKSNGLTHVALAKQLKENYGIEVSRDSLMAYEISDEFRAKASKLPNLGMRVEYLYYFADFYGVSIDYLVGKTEIQSSDKKTREVCEYTGLDEEALRAVLLYRDAGKAEVLNALLKNYYLFSVLGLIYRAAEAPDPLDEVLQGGSPIPDVSIKTVYESLAATRAMKLIEGSSKSLREKLTEK